MLKGPVSINPRRWHCAIQGEDGPRIVVAGHTIGSWRKLSEGIRRELDQAGFVLPEPEPQPQERKAAIGEENQPDFFVEPEDIIHGYDDKDSPVEVEEDIKQFFKVAAENLYTRNIEKVLKELEGDIEGGAYSTPQRGRGEHRSLGSLDAERVENARRDWGGQTAARQGGSRLHGPARSSDRSRKSGVHRQAPSGGGASVPPKDKDSDLRKFPAQERHRGQLLRRGSCRSGSAGNSRGFKESLVCVHWRCGQSVFARPRTSGHMFGFEATDCLDQGRIGRKRRSVGGTNRPLRLPVITSLVVNPPHSKDAKRSDEEGFGFQAGPSGCRCLAHLFLRWNNRRTNGHLHRRLPHYGKDVCDDAYEWMATTWEATPCQYATSTSSVRFLGMEVRMIEEDGKMKGYTLDQEGCIEELLRLRSVQPHEKSLLPATKEWMTLDPQGYPSTYTQEQLRVAQSVTGELAWLAQRCRPDLSYTVSIMGSLTTKDPERVAAIAKKALSYLNLTKEWKLVYRSDGARQLVTYTDSSYSPEGERSHGGAVVFWAGSPVAWKSSRQSLVTASSAETELLAASEGATLTYSIDAMLSDVGVYSESRELRVITLASEEGGSWRTRHLKVRAASLRQRIQEGWATMTHCPGEWQLADGLTKILASKRMEMLMARWGLGPPGALRDEGERGEVRCLQAPAEPQQHASHTSIHHPPTTAHGRELGCCMGLLVLAQWFVSAQGHKVREPDLIPEPLELSSSWELYAVVVMLAVCAIAVWEACKYAMKRGEAVRLKSLAIAQERQRLTKVELRTLSALLQRDPEMRGWTWCIWQGYAVRMFQMLLG